MYLKACRLARANGPRVSAAAVGVLWAVFSMGGGEPTRTIARAERADLKPTNVDLMAPGSQVKDVETWVGKAGRELEQYKNDREDQRRINRERQEVQEALMRRFTDLETRLKSAPGDPAMPGSPSAASSARAISPAPFGPGTAARFPPDVALARQPGLPPPPPPPALAGNRAAMPAGAPGQATLLGPETFGQAAQPALISVGGFFFHLEWGYVIAFVFFIATMFWKPEGLLSKRRRA